MRGLPLPERFFGVAAEPDLVFDGVGGRALFDCALGDDFAVGGLDFVGVPLESDRRVAGMVIAGAAVDGLAEVVGVGPILPADALSNIALMLGGTGTW